MVNNNSRKCGNQERGTALFTSLIILVAVTILALGSLGTSMLELKMASGEESTMQSFQYAQATIDEIVDNAEANFVVVGALGDKVCFDTNNSLPAGCVNDRSISLSATSIIKPVSGDALYGKVTTTIQIERTSDEICPPRSKSSSSSCDKIKAANFDIQSEAAIFGSRAELHQGFIKLIPATGQSMSRAPDFSTTN